MSRRWAAPSWWTAAGLVAATWTSSACRAVAQAVTAPDPALEWISSLAPWGAAVLAGLFGIYQLNRRNRFEQESERQKRQAADRDRENEQLRLLAQAERQRALEFKVRHLEPVMDALNRAVVQSYAALMAPRAYSQLLGHLPILRREEAKATHGWIEAMGELSDLRMRLMLSISRDDVPVVMRLLGEHAALAIDLQNTRQSFFANQSEMGDIAEVHRAYVKKSLELMLALRDTLLAGPEDSVRLSDSNRQTIADDLALPMERASTVSIKFGSPRTGAWLGMWNTSSEVIAYAMKRRHQEPADFEQRIVELTKVLHDQLESKLEIDLAVQRRGEEVIYLLSVVFGSSADLRHFVDTVLLDLKRQMPAIWTGYLTPSEFIVEPSSPE